MNIYIYIYIFPPPPLPFALLFSSVSVGPHISRKGGSILTASLSLEWGLKAEGWRIWPKVHTLSRENQGGASHLGFPKTH